jgi:hypothetical protein
MFTCAKCSKALSSKQALQYHMKSSRCVPTSISNEKMKLEADVVLECTLDGIIRNFKKNGTPVLHSAVVGKTLYDIIFQDCKFDFSMKHIMALARHDAIIRMESLSIHDVVCKTPREFSSILFVNHDSFNVYLTLRG